MHTESLPLLQHALESPSAFTPERLMEAVRAERGLTQQAVPPLCVLDFDGDLSDPRCLVRACRLGRREWPAVAGEELAPGRTSVHPIGRPTITSVSDRAARVHVLFHGSVRTSEETSTALRIAIEIVHLSSVSRASSRS